MDKNGFYISNPTWEIAQKNPNHTGRIVPIYPETKGITSKWLRWQIETIFRNDARRRTELCACAEHL